MCLYPGYTTFPVVSGGVTTKYHSTRGGDVTIDRIKNPCPLQLGSPMHDERAKTTPIPKTVLECLTCRYNKVGKKETTSTWHHFCMALDIMAQDFKAHADAISEFSGALETWNEYEQKDLNELDQQELDVLRKRRLQIRK